MRIIAGKFKGHQLVSFNANHIRPTTDRIKESLFNIIQNELTEQFIVVDLFCGTGSLGLEALSRGVSYCTFVDSHPSSIRILKRNLQKLKIAPKQYTISQIDVLKWLKISNLDQIDLFLIDPPFSQKLTDTVMQKLSQNPTLKANCLICIESVFNEKIQSKYGTIKLIKQKIFKDKSLSIFQHLIDRA